MSECPYETLTTSDAMRDLFRAQAVHGWIRPADPVLLHGIVRLLERDSSGWLRLDRHLPLCFCTLDTQRELMVGVAETAGQRGWHGHVIGGDVREDAGFPFGDRFVVLLCVPGSDAFSHIDWERSDTAWWAARDNAVYTGELFIGAESHDAGSPTLGAWYAAHGVCMSRCGADTRPVMLSAVGTLIMMRLFGDSAGEALPTAVLSTDHLKHPAGVLDAAVARLVRADVVEHTVDSRGPCIRARYSSNSPEYFPRRSGRVSRPPARYTD
jgi:hypothetical protein